MGVMGRANAGGGQVGNGEPFLNKDELIRYRTPLAITFIEYDRFGSRQYRNPRWVLTVEPWDAQNFPIPENAYPADQDADQPGLVTFGDSEVRTNQFGTGRDEQGTATGLSAQLEDARAQGVEWIGPVAVISARANNGSPYKTLADVLLVPAGQPNEGAIVVDQRGFPVLDGVPEEQETRRRQAPARAPAGPAAPPVAQPARQARRSTGQRQRAAAAAAPAPPSVPPAAPEPPAAPAAAPRVPRPQAGGPAAAVAPAAAVPAPPTAPPSAVPQARRRAAQQAPAPQGPAASSPEAYEAQQQAQARRQAVTPDQLDPRVREVTEVTVDEATAVCPFCNTEITGRLYPSKPDAFARFYAESARAFGWPPLTEEQAAAGGQVIAHPHCPMLQQTVMLPYVKFEEA